MPWLLSIVAPLQADSHGTEECRSKGSRRTGATGVFHRRQHRRQLLTSGSLRLRPRERPLPRRHAAQETTTATTRVQPRQLEMLEHPWRVRAVSLARQLEMAAKLPW